MIGRPGLCFLTGTLGVVGSPALALAGCGGDVVLGGRAPAGQPGTAPLDASVGDAGSVDATLPSEAAPDDGGAAEADAPRAVIEDANADSPVAFTAVVTLATGQNNPFDIAVDRTNVYWTNLGFSANGYGDGAVVKVPIGGGDPVTLATGPAEAIAVNASHVYWTGAGSIMRVPIDGGAVTTLVTGQVFQPPSIALDADNVYWSNAGSANSGSVMKVPLAGGVPATLAWGLNQPGEIAVDGQNAYWKEEGSSGIAPPFLGRGLMLKRVSLDGGAPEVFAEDTLSIAPARGNVIPYGTSVYSAFSWAVVRVPAGGGTPVALTPSGTGEIALDGRNIYWATTGGAIDAGTIAKVPMDGGSPAVVVSGLASPGVVAVDDTSVYWTSSNQSVVFGSILKAPK